ncbi:MAG: hypothetical protein KKA60_11885 [Proteobacteria bacterium]|nr:hypothetical protein [Pseudomonadota bacterium]
MKKRFILQTVFLVLILLFGARISMAATPPVVLEDNKASHALGLHLDMLEDPAGTLSLEDVRSGSLAGQWTPSKTTLPNLGFPDAVQWIRFRLENPLSASREMILEFAHPIVDHISLYVVRDNRTIQVKEGGDLVDFSVRDIAYRNMLFPLDLPPKSTTLCYMRFDTESSLNIPLENLRRAMRFLLTS